MTKNTGYQVIDLKNIDFVNGATITGLYEKITKANGKPLYLANIKFNGLSLGDQFSTAYLNDDEYFFSIFARGQYYCYKVNAEDYVQAD